MKREDLLEDYKLICQLKAPLKTKVGMLTLLFSTQPNIWRVVGITEEALKKFKEHEFKRVSKMGIHRSHIRDRFSTFQEMLEMNIDDPEELWAFYYENDKTILATSSENRKNGIEKYHEVAENLLLFKSKGFAWEHAKNEISFLKNLYETVYGSDT